MSDRCVAFVHHQIATKGIRTHRFLEILGFIMRRGEILRAINSFRFSVSCMPITMLALSRTRLERSWLNFMQTWCRYGLASSFHRSLFIQCLTVQAWTIKRATTTKRATGNFEGRSQPRPATIYISLLFRSMNYTKNPGVHRY